MQPARVLITGVGTELGTRVARDLEDDPLVDAITGVDIDPRARRLRRTEFVRFDPLRRERLVELVAELRPSVVVHLGVYEPGARFDARAASARTVTGTRALVQAVERAGTVKRIIVRSGLEVYGRGRGRPLLPDESVTPRPTSAFGRTLLEVEEALGRLGASAPEATDAPDAPEVLALRLAPVLAPRGGGPLGRYLRRLLVPTAGVFDAPFSVLHLDDAVAAIVAAVQRGSTGAVNVVGEGTVTGVQAARMGGRLPVPVFGPGWLVLRTAVDLLGAPLPDHLVELLRQGCTADGDACEEVLGWKPTRTTAQTVRALHDGSSVELLDLDSEPVA